MQTHPSDIPLIMNRGAPMNERCVAFNERANEENITVYALPDPQSEVVALLWNWADILQSEQGWYKIQIPQGGEGWVQAEYVDLSLGCSS